MSRRSGWLRTIAALLASAFALNFAWEMAQGSLFADMQGLSFEAATLRCLLATFGDAAIILAAYLVVAALARNPAWVRQAHSPGRALAFWAMAFGISVAMERHALATGRWVYGPYIGLVPVLEIGWPPAAQWVLLPWAVLAITKRAG
jgi:hypothetical protein